MKSPTTEAVLAARKWISKNPIYLDTETTGLGNNDLVIEIALVSHQGRVLVDSLINPNRPVPAQAAAVHGITTELARTGAAWSDIWPDVENHLSGAAVGIYNAPFDLKMIQQTHHQNWMRWQPDPGTEIFDVMELYAQFRGEWDPRSGKYRWVSLERAGQEAGLSLPNTHRAKDDSLLTRALLNQIASHPI